MTWAIGSKHSKTLKEKINVHLDFWERLFMKYFRLNKVVCQSALLQFKVETQINISALAL